MSTTPDLSVVITTYNRPALLSRAIESVLAQTYDDFECLVVDDCSTGEETKEVVDSFDDPRLKYQYHDTNRGLSAARNTGIERSRGKYVAFLDDDDEWLPSKLEKQVALFDGLDDEFAIVYCWMDYCRDEDGQVIREYRPQARGDIFPQTLDGQPIGAGSTLLVRRSVARAVGGFDESLPRGVDGDFIQRVCREYKVDYVPESLVRYYVEHGHQRITRDDTEGLRNHINSLQTTLAKFEDELEEFPDRAANIHGNIGYHYWLLGAHRLSFRYYLNALRTSPTSYPPYRWLLRGLLEPLPESVLDTVRGLRDHRFLKDVSMATGIWKNEGFQSLVHSIIGKIERKRERPARSPSVLTELPLHFLHEIHLFLDERKIAYPTSGAWRVADPLAPSNDRFLPRLSSRVAGTRHGSKKHRRMLRQLYTYEGFVKVERDDIVVDVGAYVGSFSILASEDARAVIAIEPSAAINDVLERNTKERENITVVPKAAWHRDEYLQINRSVSPSENSILAPDSSSMEQSFEVASDTVPNIVSALGFDRIDYLKVEAEGVEPEILRAALADEMEIQKVAVDASPERDGIDAVDEVTDILESNGYEYRIKDTEEWWGEYIVFGRKRGS